MSYIFIKIVYCLRIIRDDYIIIIDNAKLKNNTLGDTLPHKKESKIL